MSINIEPQTAMMYGMTTIAKAALVACSANIPVKITGESGCGKSDVVKQLTKRLNYKLYDVRVSDKEPSDIGGIPYPLYKDGEGKVIWLVANGYLPFKKTGDNLSEEDEAWNNQKCILFLDEFDRTSNIDVQNMALQILLDRSINGHELVTGCRIIIATNGTSDVGTMALSEAACKRMGHLYVDVESEETRTSWARWAETEGIHPALIGYAKSSPNEFHGSKGHEFTEEQRPCARTNVMAEKLWRACAEIPWGNEVVEPLIYGAIGRAAGANLIGYFRAFDALPKIADILSDPMNADLPDTSKGFGLFFALGHHLQSEAKVDGVEDIDRVSKFAQYVSRWPEEQQSLWFKTVSTELPSVVSTKEYKTWEKTFRI